MKKVILVASVISTLTIACGKKEVVKTERVFDINVNLENDFINVENTKKQLNAHAGDFYSGIDTVVKYGAGYVKKVDDTLKGYNLDLIVSAWVREVSAPCEGAIAVSLNGKDGAVKVWTGLKPDGTNFKEKEWVQLRDTFRFNSEKMNEVNEIKIFAIKTEGGDNFDVDDLRIKYLFHK